MLRMNRLTAGLAAYARHAIILALFVAFRAEDPSGRSSAWLERDVRDVEVACSNHVAPTRDVLLKSRTSPFLSLDNQGRQ